jgi:alginate O-acetyltransferase complex protein AlgI
MVFSSVEFLFLFLPITVGLYFISPNGGKNFIILLASMLFYLWGSGDLVLVLFVSIIVNYILGLFVDDATQANDKTKKSRYVTLAVIFNIGVLAYYKYANFFIAELAPIFDSIGINSTHWQQVILPIGISFFTFQSISYIVDISRKESRALHNPIDFGMYIAMFPQLIAGPIVRYNIVAKSIKIKNRQVTLDNFTEGSLRLYWGLTKKVLIADPCGEIADKVFALGAGDLTSPTVWLGTLCYTLQIYFDFSGYSDMAIGLGKIFGFSFPENFKRPYSAISITDFWRRWHITLSNWFRDYVYIPLGGGRRNPFRIIVNLFAVFLLTGIWHGANWTFIIWGLFHGILLFLERVSGYRNIKEERLIVVRRLLLIFIVMISWVIFRAETVEHATNLYKTMFFFESTGLSPSILTALSNWNIFIILIASIVFFLPRDYSGTDVFIRSTKVLGNSARFLLVTFLLPLSLIMIVSGSFNAFLYFQF